MSDVKEDDLYAGFVERYFESGSADIPVEWGEDLRARCRFFLKLAESREGQAIEQATGQSILSILEKSGVAADLSLPDPSGQPDVAHGGRDARYVLEREIARGGMGRIVLAYDRDFRRRIAVKVLLGSPHDSRRASRFLEEAQATAQLEHPNIAPVYDLGIDSAGSPFFTMKWIRGRNLKEVIAGGGGEISLLRLVQLLQQAAMGVHFANSRGVIHRDLKPQNIMVGDYGEVLVVDWGLAKVLRRQGEELREQERVSTERREEGAVTLDGTVQGSLAYMAPEQARGDAAAIDARTDVFGLGAILYEILTGLPPYPEGSFQALLGKARRGEIVPPRERAPARSIPPLLEEVARKALAPRQEDRFQSARELHDAIQGYIEGIHDAERRAAEAGRLRDVADRLRVDLAREEEREAALRREEEALRSSLAEHDPEERKRPLWDLSARVHAAREGATAAFNRATAAYMAVLSIEAEDRASRSALAGIYYRRLHAAEARGDREAAALYEGLVAQHHDGRYSVELEGKGFLRLASDPPGAQVVLARYEQRGPLLEEAGAGAIGAAPIEKALPRGSYLAVLRMPGFVETRYPVLVERSTTCEAAVRLVPEGSIPDGFVHIPGGETVIGGDPGEIPAYPRGKAFVADLLVARFPVTLGEYCAFLNSTVPASEPVPRELLPSFGAEEYVVRAADGLLTPLPNLDPRVPVLAIPRSAAAAYCGWLSSRLGKSVRLLTEIEWERCARGADGRTYPWGNGFDWTLTKGRPSRPGEPFPEPVGTFPRDVSPFGIRDLAGCVRELCDGWYGEGYRPVRGGSWYIPIPAIFRADCRTMLREGSRATDVGFRVCYDGAR